MYDLFRDYRLGRSRVFKVGFKYGRFVIEESGGMYRLCFIYSTWSVDKILHSLLKFQFHELNRVEN